MPQEAAAPTKGKMTAVSSSAIVPIPHGDITTEFQKFVPTVDYCMSITAEALHTALQASITGTIICYNAAKVLAVAAKLRMQNGEAVGGCLTFTGPGGYVLCLDDNVPFSPR